MAGSSYGFWLQEVESIRHEECRVEGFRMKGRTKLGAESSALNWKKCAPFFVEAPQSSKQSATLSPHQQGLWSS